MQRAGRWIFLRSQPVTHGVEDLNFLRPPTGELMEVWPKKRLFSTLFSTPMLVFFLFFGGGGVEAGMWLSRTIPWYAHPNATFIPF